MDPRHAVFAIIESDHPAHLCAFVVNRNFQAFWKAPFDQVATHTVPSSFFLLKVAGNIRRRGQPAHRLSCLIWSGTLPILLEQSGLEGMRNGFGSRTRVELRQYRRDVMINSSCGCEEALGDFSVT